MSGEVRQFCGAATVPTSDGRLSAYCGSAFSKDGGAYQSNECEERQRERNSSELARFRAMFPTIMPDDPRPITRWTCLELGMTVVDKQRPWWSMVIHDLRWTEGSEPRARARSVD